MINHNTLMYKVFDRTITIEDYLDQNWLVNYAEGDLFELVANLQDKEAKYPIIWLQTGYTVERRKLEGITKMAGCRFFLITLGSKTDRYQDRFEDTYQNILYPLLHKIDERFRKTSGLKSDDNDSYMVFPLNDLAKDEEGKNIPQLTAIADVWDAVLFQTDITITDDCFPEFKIK